MFSFIYLIELTLEKVIANIPHDAGAFLAYGILALFVAFIWVGSRPKTNGSQRKRSPV